jgi:hypothetical protein
MLAFAFLAVIFCLAVKAEAQEPELSRIPAQTVTLLSQSKHKDYDRGWFSFRMSVRGEVKISNRGAYRDLRYGGITDNGDNHWFDVNMGKASKSVLKDLGDLNWSDVHFVPILLAGPMPHSGPVSWAIKDGKVTDISPEGVNIRAVAGHLYVMHVKEEDSDFYVMFRVESLEPEGECRLSWKRVPSPEAN